MNRFVIPWTAKCNSNNWLSGLANLSGPIAEGGVFSATLNRTVDLGGGQQSVEVDTLGGTVTLKQAVGAWQVAATLVDGTGTNVDTCDSGQVTFKLL